MNKVKIYFILGPTAVGKTEYAIRLAKELGTDIISCDSRQVYKDMDIGTAKPSLKQQAEVRHHLIDLVPPNEKYTVYDYIKDAEKEVEQCEIYRRVPLFVGGTPLYAKLLIAGIFEMPPVPKEIEDKVAALTKDEVIAEIEKCDRETFASVPTNDEMRYRRALTVFYTTGQTIGELRKNTKPSGFEPHYIILTRDREELYRFVDNRVDIMLNFGLVDEVQHVVKEYFGGLQEVFSGQSKALLSIGYEEILKYFAGEYELDDAIELIKRNTRRFAKRQITFFKKFPNAVWLNLTGKSDDEVLSFLREQVNWL